MSSRVLKPSKSIGDREHIRKDSALRIHDKAVVLILGNVDTNINHSEPPEIYLMLLYRRTFYARSLA